MPRFDTSGPISITIDTIVGDVLVSAGDRQDTVVEVRPSDPSSEQDVRSAEQTRVEYAAGQLLVKAPKQRGLGLFGKVGSIDVTIEAPAGSAVQAAVGVASLRGVGRLGECRVKSATGDVRLDETGPLDLHTAAGGVSVERVTGHAEVHTGSGRVRLGEVDGSAQVKNSNGDSWIGRVTGDLRVNAANGDIVVDRAGAAVTAATANGNVRVGGIARGSSSLKTAFGEIEIGIGAGTAARLDVSTDFGRVRNQLDAAEGPAGAEQTAEVRARTSFGDIVIRRTAKEEVS